MAPSSPPGMFGPRTDRRAASGKTQANAGRPRETPRQSLRRPGSFCLQLCVSAAFAVSRKLVAVVVERTLPSCALRFIKSTAAKVAGDLAAAWRRLAPPDEAALRFTTQSRPVVLLPKRLEFRLGWLTDQMRSAGSTLTGLRRRLSPNTESSRSASGLHVASVVVALMPQVGVRVGQCGTYVDCESRRNRVFPSAEKVFLVPVQPGAFLEPDSLAITARCTCECSEVCIDCGAVHTDGQTLASCRR